jgi:hypothetical protein
MDNGENRPMIEKKIMLGKEKKKKRKKGKSYIS